MTQLFDVRLNDYFEWQRSIYRLDSVVDDQAIAVCVARKNIHGKWISVQGNPENFNPYADVNVGKIELLWVPNKA